MQELLRHSTSRMTPDTYTQALGPDKRAAQSKVVGRIRPKERVFSAYRDSGGSSAQMVDKFGVPKLRISNTELDRPARLHSIVNEDAYTVDD